MLAVWWCCPHAVRDHSASGRPVAGLTEDAGVTRPRTVAAYGAVALGVLRSRRWWSGCR